MAKTKAPVKKASVTKSKKRAADVKTKPLKDKAGPIVPDVPDQVKEAVENHVEKKRLAGQYAEEAAFAKDSLDVIFKDLKIKPGTTYHVPIPGTDEVYVATVELKRSPSCKRLKQSE